MLRVEWIKPLMDRSHRVDGGHAYLPRLLSITRCAIGSKRRNLKVMERGLLKAIINPANGGDVACRNYLASPVTGFRRLAAWKAAAGDRDVGLPGISRPLRKDSPRTGLEKPEFYRILNEIPTVR